LPVAHYLLPIGIAYCLLPVAYCPFLGSLVLACWLACLLAC